MGNEVLGENTRQTGIWKLDELGMECRLLFYVNHAWQRPSFLSFQVIYVQRGTSNLSSFYPGPLGRKLSVPRREGAIGNIKDLAN